MGCQWQSDKRPSILIIAIESLSFSSVNCDQRQDFEKGFKILCDEAIRFTHHYTTSTQSQSALASILTARYPVEHGVWHNGNQYLSSHFTTVAEVAVEKGYKTSFFSGGPPIFNKSGLGQGFEKFDDNIRVTLNEYYRPVQKNFAKFLRWIDFETGDQPFFSIIYLPDLQFTDQATVTDLGQERARNYNGQLQELDESLGSFIARMKEKKLWHNTHVFIVGLNGYSEESRPDEPSVVNLYSEIVQTPFFIKPAQKIRDQGINWKIDRNVSLVDLGATLFDLFDYQPEIPKDRDLEVTSLLSVMDKPDVAWDSQRFILIESAYPQWRGMGGSRFSIRSGHYSLIYDKKIKLFNTLIDRNELNSISPKDNLWTSIFLPIAKYLKDNGLNQWEGLDQRFLDRSHIAKFLINPNLKNNTEKISEINKIIRKYKKDKEFYGWKAELALSSEQWKVLMHAALKTRNKYWLYLAKKKLGQPIKISKGGCFQFFELNIKDVNKLRDCEDTIFVTLMRWKMEKATNKKELIFDKFVREYYNYKLEKKLKMLNVKNELNWDVPLEKNYGPSITEVYLNLTKNRKLKERIESRLLKI
ncbi:MAG: sulfatase-like hydrolase/transferase [Bdellovibrionaceae bacterium]|nr:sulfatase-like hydrolase/transferase [Pseudobdellovibrionaceae bacterium]